MAVEVRYVGTRGVNQWSELNYNELNIEENGFYDEFRLAMANLQANQAAADEATRSRIRVFRERRRCRSTSPTSMAGPTSTIRLRIRAPTGRQHGIHQRHGPAQPESDELRQGPRRESGAVETTPIDDGLPSNFFVVNPAVDDVTCPTAAPTATTTRCKSRCGAGCRRGFTVNANYQYALEGGSAFLGFHYGRVLNPTPNVRHAIKTQWNWSLPVGRGRRFGTDMHPILNGIVGNWDFKGSGRIQARVLNFGNVRLVNMNAKDLQDMYSFRIIPDPANPGQQLVTMLPDDVILNTRRAFSTSPTTSTGYGALGAPEGPHIAPANSENCIQLKAGDCAPRTLLIRAPFFTRFDIGVTKRFPLSGSLNFELRVDVLNVFDNINFNPVANPGSGDTIFQVGTAYRDPDNNFDPGGRLGQLSFRINW